MKALILVGGYGTRLRPLTFTMPKPLVPFCNKPILIHQIEALKEAGVTEVVLAVAYQPDALKAQMDQWEKALGVKISYSHETTPMGTAGPLALARDILTTDNEPFFVLNSDVTCKFPLKELLAFHKHHGGEGTIMVTQVEQWHKYGVVVYDEETGLINQFVEKPKNFVGDKINSGIYIFNKTILDRIKLERTSIETQVFPAMAGDKQLYCKVLEGFWMDIGQPHDYLEGVSKYLLSLDGTSKGGMLITDAQANEKGFQVLGTVMIDPTATVGAGSVIGPHVTIGPNCVIGPSVRLSHTAVFDNSKIGAGTYINKSIIGWNNTIGDWCRIDNYSVFGDDVQVKPELYVNGVKVLPNKGLKESYDKPEIVM